MLPGASFVRPGPPGPPRPLVLDRIRRIAPDARARAQPAASVGHRLCPSGWESTSPGAGWPWWPADSRWSCRCADAPCGYQVTWSAAPPTVGAMRQLKRLVDFMPNWAW